MYESHFGFSGPPFQLNPDPAFYFNSRGHGHALAYLRYGVAQGEGFIVVTGEIGAGKTTLLRALLDELDRSQVVAAQIVSTQLESGDLLQAIITAFGIPTQGNGKASLISTLEAFLMTLATQGRRALLIIDEAQNLEIRAIEELRMLSNFQLGTQSLLQSFLVGQPELRKKLESKEMEQLRQRVTASCHLGPLGVEETRGYVEHRLKRVGWSNRPSFDDAAFDQIYRWSGGVPRRINRLCNRLLLAAFLEGRETIVSDMVESTAQELRQEIGEASFEPLPMPTRADAPSAVASEVQPSVAATTGRAEAVSEGLAQPLAPAEPGPAPEAMAVVASEVAPDVADQDTSIVSDAGLPAVEPVAAQPTVIPLDVAERPATNDEPEVTALREPTAAVATPVDMPVVEPDMAVAASANAGVESSVVAISRPAAAVVRMHAVVQKPRACTLLCVADTTAGALKLAAVGKALDALGNAPGLVLVNPHAPVDAWPWDDMESILPAPQSAIHLGVPRGRLETCAAEVFARFGPLIDEFEPHGVVTVGDSDAVLACHLLAHKRGVPVLRLEAGQRGTEEGSARLNAALMEQMSNVLFAANSREAHQQLYRTGVAFNKVFGVPGQLAVDVLAAALPSMTTPYGAFLRHRLPIFLGPRWSSEVDGTAYAVLTLQLDPTEPARVAAVLKELLLLPETPKLLWLADDATRAALRNWQLAHGEQAAEVFIVEDTLPRSQIDRRNSARILCSDIRSLADQLSIVRGAIAAISHPGDMVAEVAVVLDIPTVLVEGDQLVLTVGASASQRPTGWSAGALAQGLDQCIAYGKAAEPVDGLAQAPQAASVIAARLAAWAARAGGTAESVAGALASSSKSSPRTETADRQTLAA